MISQPSWTRPWAKATIPRLSLTEISARGMPERSRVGLHGFWKRDWASGPGRGEDHRREQPVLGLEHPGREAVGIVVRKHRHPRAGQDLAPIVDFVPRCTLAPLSRA